MESTQTLKLINVDIIYILMQYHPSLSEMIIGILSDFIHELITISFFNILAFAFCHFAGRVRTVELTN